MLLTILPLLISLLFNFLDLLKIHIIFYIKNKQGNTFSVKIKPGLTVYTSTFGLKTKPNQQQAGIARLLPTARPPHPQKSNRLSLSHRSGVLTSGCLGGRQTSPGDRSRRAPVPKLSGPRRGCTEHHPAGRKSASRGVLVPKTRARTRSQVHTASQGTAVHW